MTKKLSDILNELGESGQSESIAVAECLDDIAANGGEQATDKFLLVCAGEIRDVAQAVIDRMRTKKEQKRIEKLAEKYEAGMVQL